MHPARSAATTAATSVLSGASNYWVPGLAAMARLAAEAEAVELRQQAAGLLASAQTQAQQRLAAAKESAEQLLSTARAEAETLRRDQEATAELAEAHAAAGYPTLQAAHDAAVCARLWAAERRGNGAGPDDDDPVEPS